MAHEHVHIHMHMSMHVHMHIFLGEKAADATALVGGETGFADALRREQGGRLTLVSGLVVEPKRGRLVLFSSGGEKPYEVEIFVAEIGDGPAGDQIYRLTYDGQVYDEHRFAVMGGTHENVVAFLTEHYHEGASLEGAVRVAVDALGHDDDAPRTIPLEDLEVAVLDRTRSQQRKFRRLRPEALVEVLGTRTALPATEDASASASGSASSDGDDPPVAPPVS